MSVYSNSCFYFSRWLVSKTRATLSTNEKCDTYPNHVLNTHIFPPLALATWTCLVRILTGSLGYLHLLSQEFALRPSQYEAFVNNKEEWISDKFFTQQRLAGVNPMSLMRVTLKSDGKRCMKNTLIQRLTEFVLIVPFWFHSTDNRPFWVALSRLMTF